MKGLIAANRRSNVHAGSDPQTTERSIREHELEIACLLGFHARSMIGPDISSNVHNVAPALLEYISKRISVIDSEPLKRIAYVNERIVIGIHDYATLVYPPT